MTQLYIYKLTAIIIEGMDNSSSQAMVFESVFYSLHTVAAWACLTLIARIYYDVIRPIRSLSDKIPLDTLRRPLSNEMTPFISRSVWIINKDMEDSGKHGTIFTMSSVKRIFATDQPSDIQFNTVNNPVIAFYSNWRGKVAMLPSVSKFIQTTNLLFHWSTIITSPYHILFIEKVISSELLIKQPRYGGSRRRTQIPWLATIWIIMSVKVYLTSWTLPVYITTNLWLIFACGYGFLVLVALYEFHDLFPILLPTFDWSLRVAMVFSYLLLCMNFMICSLYYYQPLTDLCV